MLDPSATRSFPGQGSVAILVVEDDLITSHNISAILKRYGYLVKGTADSGEQALEFLSREQVDIVLMDIMLGGGLDGVSASGEIWQRFRIPVIYITGHSDIESVDRAKETAPYGYIIKPFQPLEIYSAIETALVRISLERDIAESESKYRTLFETMAQGVIYFDTALRIISLNPAAERILGLSEPECLGATLDELNLSALSENGSECRWDELPAARSLRSCTEVRNEVIRLYNNWNRSWIWVIVNAIPLFRLSDGKVCEVYTTLEDITPRKEAELELARRAWEFETLVENNPDIVLRCDRFQNCLYVSQAVSHELGIEPSSLTGRGLGEGLPFPDLAALLLGKTELIAEKGEEASFEAAVLLPDGMRHYMARAVPEFSLAGRVESILFILRNITERKQAEQAMLESERRFRALIENSSDAIALLGADAVFIYSSPGVTRILGYEPEEIIGRKAFEFIDPVMMVDVVNLFVQMIRESSKRPTAQFRVIDKNGRMKWVEAVGQNLLSEPAVHAIVINYRDITEKKLSEKALMDSEQRYRTSFENVTDVILTFSVDGNILDVTPSVTRVLGLRPQDIIGSSILNKKFMKKNYLPRLKTELEQVLAGESFVSSIYEIFASDGSVHFMETSSSPRIEEGNVIGGVSVLRDISERIDLENRILSLVEEERTRIGQNLHDGVGQQLTGMGFLCEFLVKKLRDTGSPEADEAVELLNVINEARRQTRALARGLNPIDFDASGFLPAVEEFLRVAERMYKVTCRLRHDFTGPLEKHATNHLYYIIMEAVNNAAKHGQVKRIEVSLTETEDRFELSIRDDGRGFAEETAQPSGLGLQIMRSRARLIGGLIQINRTGSGETEVLCLVEKKRAG